MRKSRFILIPVFALSALLVLTALSAPAAANELAIINVSGTGSLTVKPDSAQISLGVVTQGSTAATAQKDNAQIANRLLDALLKSGIAETQIQTKDFNVQPQYDYNIERTGGPKIVGYEARNTVVVHIKDLDTLGSVLDTARDAGVNQISNIRFLTSQENELRTKALSAAVADARTKANTVASALGKSVSDVVNVSVESNSYAVPYLEKQMADNAAGVDYTRIMTGELTISSSVQIQFSMK